MSIYGFYTTDAKYIKKKTLIRKVQLCIRIQFLQSALYNLIPQTYSVTKTSIT